MIVFISLKLEASHIQDLLLTETGANRCESGTSTESIWVQINAITTVAEIKLLLLIENQIEVARLIIPGSD